MSPRRALPSGPQIKEGGLPAAAALRRRRRRGVEGPGPRMAQPDRHQGGSDIPQCCLRRKEEGEAARSIGEGKRSAGKRYG